MTRKLLQTALCLILCPLLVAQQLPAPASIAYEPLSTIPVPATTTQSRTVQIKNDTLVALRVEQSISSADARVGDKVRFTLVNDLVADGVLIAPAGTSFYSTITSVRSKDDHHNGRISFSFTEPDLGHGKRLRLIDEVSKERKEYREEEIFWFTYGTIILAPMVVPMLPITLAEYALHPHPHSASQKNQKLIHRDLCYSKGNVVKFYVQHTLKIRTDQLAASNTSALIQRGIGACPRSRNQDTSTPRSVGSGTTIVFIPLGN